MTDTVQNELIRLRREAEQARRRVDTLTRIGNLNRGWYPGLNTLMRSRMLASVDLTLLVIDIARLERRALNES